MTVSREGAQYLPTVQRSSAWTLVTSDVFLLHQNKLAQCAPPSRMHFKRDTHQAPTKQGQKCYGDPIYRINKNKYQNAGWANASWLNMFQRRPGPNRAEPSTAYGRNTIHSVKCQPAEGLQRRTVHFNSCRDGLRTARQRYRTERNQIWALAHQHSAPFASANIKSTEKAKKNDKNTRTPCHAAL